MRRVLVRVVVPVVLVVCILLSLPGVCGQDHAHHHHPEEPPAYKWSKQANEAYLDEPQEAHSHHSHDSHSHSHHSHDSHSHSHGSHPHSHDSHPHSHGSHPHSHGSHSHSHDSHPHSHSHSHSHSHDEPPAYKWSKSANEQDSDAPQSVSRSSVWVEALAATLVISVAPYIILFFIPVTNSREHQPFLKVLLAFASGGLLGDAFLHLIPHALMAQASSGGHTVEGHGSHGHSHGGEHGAHDMSIGLAVLGGIIAFLVVEKVVRIFKGGHSHGHSHSVQAGARPANGEAKADADKLKKAVEKQDNDKKKTDKKKNAKGSEKKTEGNIKVAGYLNLAADFTHNLTDGLAIGASFLAGKNVGIVTTITIFLHEIPHEIGDFAILLQSGCSRRKAMMLQLVTALGALTGTVISLLAEGADDSAVAWILPFTAGGFIYIATVSVIPELLENTRFWQSVFEVVALLGGVVLMMAIAHLEEMGHEH